MFKALREEKDGVPLIRLSGVLDETVDLRATLDPLPSPVVIGCREVSQINSMGTKAWMEYFGQAAAKGTSFSFSDCPPCLVEQLNYVSGFSCGGAILSVAAPYTCEGCRRELRGIVKAEDLVRFSYRLPPIKCPKCSCKAIFDDRPEEYFAFLIRLRRQA